MQQVKSKNVLLVKIHEAVQMSLEMFLETVAQDNDIYLVLPQSGGKLVSTVPLRMEVYLGYLF